MQCGGADQPLGEQRPGDRNTRIERSCDLGWRKFTNSLRYEPVAKIVIRSESAGWNADDVGMTRQVHCVGEDGCGGVGHGRMAGKNRDRVGDTEGETAAAPAAGGNAAHWLRGVQFNFAEK